MIELVTLRLIKLINSKTGLLLLWQAKALLSSGNKRFQNKMVKELPANT